METDIGNPIEYTPSNNDVIEDSTHINDESLQEPYYQPHPSEMMYQPPPNFGSQNEKNDFFSKVDKSTWIIAFAVFLLGFFMGKTMQPVILRYN
jgi:hypothetical protein|tara:strand:- start:1617 stop:1898 length:282 start_codon:yes stop_codon:yes gene_type:complete